MDDRDPDDLVAQGGRLADQVLNQINELPPAQRLRALQSLLGHFDRRREQICQVRLQVIKEQRAAGVSYEELAATLGLSKSRVQQLAAQARRQLH